MRKLRRALELMVELFRELGDENAYRRFLAERGTAASAQEWRLFTDRRHAARFKRAKCC